MNENRKYAKELDFALALVKEAGGGIMRHFNSNCASQLKADGTFVTQADKEAERTICQRIAEQFAGDGILGEEDDTHINIRIPKASLKKKAGGLQTS